MLFGNLDNLKLLLEITTSAATLIGLFFSAYIVYGILSISSKPIINIDNIIFWPENFIRDIPDNCVITTQISFLNPAIGSQVVTKFEIEKLILEDWSKENVEYYPYAILRNTHDCDGKIKLEVDDFIHPFIMMGSAELIKTIAFINNEKKGFSFSRSDYEIKLMIKQKVHSPLLRIPLIKFFIKEDPTKEPPTWSLHFEEEIILNEPTNLTQKLKPSSKKK